MATIFRFNFVPIRVFAKNSKTSGTMVLPPNQLWMGELEEYMNEEFIVRSFSKLNATVLKVKVQKAKNNMKYAILEFKDSSTAIKTLRKWNGVIVPDSNPLTSFKLNWTAHGKAFNPIMEYTAFVGNLTPDIDDLKLLHFFYQRYLSLKSAKIILNSEGTSQGYGFLKFADENECSRAILEMNGVTGLGFRPICCGHSVPDLVQKSKSFLYAYIPLPDASASSNYYSSWPATGGTSQSQASGSFTVSSAARDPVSGQYYGDITGTVVSTTPTAMANSLCTTTYSLNNSHMSSQSLPSGVRSLQNNSQSECSKITDSHQNRQAASNRDFCGEAQLIYGPQANPNRAASMIEISPEDRRLISTIGDPQFARKEQLFALNLTTLNELDWNLQLKDPCNFPGFRFNASHRTNSIQTSTFSSDRVSQAKISATPEQSNLPPHLSKYLDSILLQKSNL